jgi:hypothetical protein
MKCCHLIAFLAVSILLNINSEGQTCLLAKPISDAQGYATFQVVQILRIEGTWEKTPYIGQLFYPTKREKAYPLSRFGEAVLIELPESDNYAVWKGLHIHNGCIPAMSGMDATTLLGEIASAPVPVTKSHEEAPVHTVTNSVANGLRECPICHKYHIRLD